MKQTRRGQAYGESAFDICYIITVIGFGLWYIVQGQSKNSSVLLLYGSMALVLGFGDAFHLIPRILFHFARKPENYISHLGIGKMITSITMTIFYVMLYYVWMALYPALRIHAMIPISIFVLAGVRIILCLFPQNRWRFIENTGKWPIYRNIPFFLLGIMIILLYAYSGQHIQDGFSLMPLAIALSFLCYAPVTLWANKHPMIGMLMIPKTLMYIWIVCMGIQLL